MSIEAISWALSAQVGDTTRKMVLLGYANHAHKDGRNAWASKDTIAEYSECSNKTVRRHVQQLIADGWMREGDQDQVSHLRADRRPVVYDLAMNEATRALWAAQERGDTVTPGEADVIDLTTGQPVPPSTAHDRTPATGRDDATGGHPCPPRGVTGDPQTVQEPTTPPSPRQRGATGTTPTCTKPGPIPHSNCRACGTTARELEKAARRRAAEQAREAERAAAATERRRKAQLQEAGPSLQAAAALEEARQAIATNRSNR